jgi:hypothetical protein
VDISGSNVNRKIFFTRNVFDFNVDVNMTILTSQHVPVSSISDGEQMRGDFGPPLAQVELDGRRGVDRKPLVRVHHHAEQSRVRLIKQI